MSPILSSQFLYEAAPIPSCHAATIVETTRGLLAAFFGGSKEGAADVCIWLCHFTDGRWSEPMNVADGAQRNGTRFPTWNPVLFQPRNGPVMLFYKVGSNPHSWWGMFRSSEDGGRTWSDAARLPDGILGPIKNKPVQLSSGDILSPTSIELGDEQGWHVYFERSTDDGKTWSSTAHVESDTKIDAIQPSILVHSTTQLQALGRTRSGRMFETWSQDAGKTWSKLSLMDLPNCNSGTDAVTLHGDGHLLVYNHSCAEKARWPLNLARSRDGRTWQAAALLENETPVDARGGPGQYSYPSMIQSGDGLVHIVYTWNRERICHKVIDPSALASVSIHGSLWPRGLPAPSAPTGL